MHVMVGLNQGDNKISLIDAVYTWCNKCVFLIIAALPKTVAFFQKMSAKPNVAVNEIRAVAAEDWVRPLISLVYCFCLFTWLPRPRCM
jgi:hypothetical protein